jgi:hypothetical protein
MPGPTTGAQRSTRHRDQQANRGSTLCAVVPLDVRPVFVSGEFEVFVSVTQFPSRHFAQLQGSP